MLLKNLKLVKGSLLSLFEWPRSDIKTIQPAPAGQAHAGARQT